MDPTLIGGPPNSECTLQEFVWTRFSWEAPAHRYRIERASVSSPTQVLLYTPTGQSDIGQLTLRAGDPVLLQGDLLEGLYPTLTPGPTIGSEKPIPAIPLRLKDNSSDDVLRGITFRVRRMNASRTVVDLECLYVEAHTDPLTGLVHELRAGASRFRWSRSPTEAIESETLASRKVGASSHGAAAAQSAHAKKTPGVSSRAHDQGNAGSLSEDVSTLSLASVQSSEATTVTTAFPTCHLDECPTAPLPFKWCPYDKVIAESSPPTDFCSAGDLSEDELVIDQITYFPLTTVCTYVSGKLTNPIDIPALMRAGEIHPNELLCEQIHGDGRHVLKWKLELQEYIVPGCFGCTCAHGTVSVIHVNRIREIGLEGAGHIESLSPPCRLVCESFGPCCPTPPIAVINGSEGLFCVQDSSSTNVTFDGSSSDGENLQYSWRVDGEEVGTSPLLSHTLGEGIHQVQLTVTDSCTSSTDSTTVEIRRTPEAAISGVDPIVCTTTIGGTAQVVLSGSGSTGSITTYAWTLSGAASASGSGVQFDAGELGPGRYTAELTVTGEGSGCEDTASLSFTVTDPQPVIGEILRPCVAAATDSARVLLDGSASSDPGGLPLTYQWTISPAAAIEDTSNVSTAATLAPGDYEVSLTVSVGQCERTGTKTFHVRVTPEARIVREPAGSRICLERDPSDPSATPGTLVRLSLSDRVARQECDLDYEWKILRLTESGSELRLESSLETPPATFLGSGQYQVSVTLRSKFDSRIKTTLTDSFRLDSPPAIVSVSPQQIKCESSPSRFEVQVLDDFDTPESGLSIDWSVEGPTSFTGSGTPLVAPELPGGEYSGRVIIRDSCPHEVKREFSFRVDGKPRVSVSGPSCITQGGIGRFTGSADDPESGPISPSVWRWFLDGQTSPMAVGVSQLDLPTGSLSAGFHRIRLEAVDEPPCQQKTTGSLDFQVDPLEIRVLNPSLAAGHLWDTVHSTAVEFQACSGTGFRISLAGGEGTNPDTGATLVFPDSVLRSGESTINPSGGLLRGTLLSADIVGTVLITLATDPPIPGAIAQSAVVSFEKPSALFTTTWSDCFNDPASGTFYVPIQVQVQLSHLGQAVIDHRLALAVDRVLDPCGNDVTGQAGSYVVVDPTPQLTRGGTAIFQARVLREGDYSFRALDLSAFTSSGLSLIYGASPVVPVRSPDALQIRTSSGRVLGGQEALELSSCSRTEETLVAIGISGDPACPTSSGTDILLPTAAWSATGGGTTPLVRFSSTQGAQVAVTGMAEGHGTIKVRYRTCFGDELVTAVPVIVTGPAKILSFPMVSKLLAGDSFVSKVTAKPAAGSFSFSQSGDGLVNFSFGTPQEMGGIRHQQLGITGVRAGRVTVALTYTPSTGTDCATTATRDLLILENPTRVTLIDVLRRTRDGRILSIRGDDNKDGDIFTNAFYSDQSFVYRFRNPGPPARIQLVQTDRDGSNRRTPDFLQNPEPFEVPPGISEREFVYQEEASRRTQIVRLLAFATVSASPPVLSLALPGVLAQTGGSGQLTGGSQQTPIPNAVECFGGNFQVGQVNVPMAERLKARVWHIPGLYDTRGGGIQDGIRVDEFNCDALIKAYGTKQIEEGQDEAGRDKAVLLADQPVRIEGSAIILMQDLHHIAPINVILSNQPKDGSIEVVPTMTSIIQKAHGPEDGERTGETDLQTITKSLSSIQVQVLTRSTEKVQEVIPTLGLFDSTPQRVHDEAPSDFAELKSTCPELVRDLFSPGPVENGRFYVTAVEPTTTKAKGKGKPGPSVPVGETVLIHVTPEAHEALRVLNKIDKLEVDTRTLAQGENVMLGTQGSEFTTSQVQAIFNGAWVSARSLMDTADVNVRFESPQVSSSLEEILSRLPERDPIRKTTTVVVIRSADQRRSDIEKIGGFAIAVGQKVDFLAYASFVDYNNDQDVNIFQSQDERVFAIDIPIEHLVGLASAVEPLKDAGGVIVGEQLTRLRDPENSDLSARELELILGSIIVHEVGHTLGLVGPQLFGEGGHNRYRRGRPKQGLSDEEFESRDAHLMKRERGRELARIPQRFRPFNLRCLRLMLPERP